MSSTTGVQEVINFLRNFEKIIAPAETVEQALYLLEQHFVAKPKIGYEIQAVTSAADKNALAAFVRGMGINPAAHCWWLHRGGYEAFLAERRKMVQDKNQERSRRSREKKQ